MAYTVEVRVNHLEVRALLGDRVNRIGQKVREVAQRRTPKASGALTASLHVIVGDAPGFVYADIGSNLRYAYYIHQGTGVYAGHGPITAKTGRVMRFQPRRPVGPLRGSGKFYRGPRKPSPWVYARSVKGVQRHPFLTSALSDVVGASATIRTLGR